MITVVAKTNTVRNREVSAEVTSTPASVFAEIGANIAGSMVTLNGQTLTVTELNSAFETLGVRAGDTVNLTAIVKADGAM